MNNNPGILIVGGDFGETPRKSGVIEKMIAGEGITCISMGVLSKNLRR